MVNPQIMQLFMVGGLWLMAQASWLTARGSRFLVHGQQKRRGLHLRHESWGMIHEPSAMKHQTGLKHHAPTVKNQKLHLPTTHMWKFIDWGIDQLIDHLINWLIDQSIDQVQSGSIGVAWSPHSWNPGDLQLRASEKMFLSWLHASTLPSRIQSRGIVIASRKSLTVVEVSRKEGDFKRLILATIIFIN